MEFRNDLLRYIRAYYGREESSEEFKTHQERHPRQDDYDTMAEYQMPRVMRALDSIPEFDGMNIPVEMFIAHVRSRLSSGFPGDVEKLHYLVFEKLQGRVRQLIYPIRGDYPSAYELLADLRSLYSPDEVTLHRKRNLQSQLENIFQGFSETIHEYATRITHIYELMDQEIHRDNYYSRALTYNLRAINYSNALSCFVSGLREQLITYVWQRRPTTIEDAVLYAYEAEECSHDHVGHRDNCTQCNVQLARVEHCATQISFESNTGYNRRDSSVKRGNGHSFHDHPKNSSIESPTVHYEEINYQPKGPTHKNTCPWRYQPEPLCKVVVPNNECGVEDRQPSPNNSTRPVVSDTWSTPGTETATPTEFIDTTKANSVTPHKNSLDSESTVTVQRNNKTSSRHGDGTTSSKVSTWIDFEKSSPYDMFHQPDGFSTGPSLTPRPPRKLARKYEKRNTPSASGNLSSSKHAHSSSDTSDGRRKSRSKSPNKDYESSTESEPWWDKVDERSAQTTACATGEVPLDESMPSGIQLPPVTGEAPSKDSMPPVIQSSLVTGEALRTADIGHQKPHSEAHFSATYEHSASRNSSENNKRTNHSRPTEEVIDQKPSAATKVHRLGLTKVLTAFRSSDNTGKGFLASPHARLSSDHKRESFVAGSCEIRNGIG